jgi:hypothetical protein
MTSEFIVQVKFPDGTILTMWNDEHRTCQYIGSGSASRCIAGDTWEKCLTEFEIVGREKCKITTNMFDRFCVEGERYDMESGGVCKPKTAFFNGNRWVAKACVNGIEDEFIR